MHSEDHMVHDKFQRLGKRIRTEVKTARRLDCKVVDRVARTAWHAVEYDCLNIQVSRAIAVHINRSEPAGLADRMVAGTADSALRLPRCTAKHADRQRSYLTARTRPFGAGNRLPVRGSWLCSTTFRNEESHPV